MTTKKEDIRITKTKKALTEAFFEMLAVTPLEDITVNDLCQKADVRRATFYKHFRDKSDFIVFLIKEARVRFGLKEEDFNFGPQQIKDYYLKCSEAIMAYLLRYESTLKKIIVSDMRPTFIEMFVRQNYEDTVKCLERNKDSGIDMFATTDAMASMLIGGIAHAIVYWFEDENRVSSEVLLADISAFIEKLLS